MIGRFVIALIYTAFTLVTGIIPVSGVGEGAAHSCCCSAANSCCDAGTPMDCCVDDSEDLPAPAQIATTQFSLEVPFIAQHKTAEITAFETSNLKLQTSNLEPNQGRVKPYIAFHKLILYA